MKWLSGVEGALEGVFEGALTRIFRPRVQPAEIAKRLERSMEANQTIGVGKVYAPNSYEVRLSPRDYEAFSRYRTSLERELTAYLQDTARDLGLTLVTRPTVRVVSHDDVKPGGVHVSSWLQDVEQGETPHGLEFTQPIAVQRTRQREPQAATLTVVAGRQNGERYPLSPGRVRMGRGLENQIVLEDPRVSRHHAEVYQRGAEWFLRDLNSTNGTYVNGYGVRERALESGDRISLGGVELVFHSRTS